MRKSFFLLLVFIAAVFSGCADETNPIDQEEHFEPEGWLIENTSGNPVLVVWQAQLQSSWNNNAIPRIFSVNLNDSTGILKVRFLKADKQFLDYPADQEYSLGWLLTDPVVLGISAVQQDRWSFRLKGLAAGTTTIELRVLHGGHADVRTPLITVEVN